MAKQKRMSADKIKMVDVHYLGAEPRIKEPVPVNSYVLSKAYSWYNYFYTRKDGKKWMLDYMKKNAYNKKQISLMAAVDENKLPLMFCSTARMILNDSFVPDGIKTKLKRKIDELLEERKEILSVKKKEAAPKPTVSVQDYMNEKISGLIANIDDQIDLFVKANYNPEAVKFSLYNELVKDNVKAPLIKKMLKHYDPLLNELNALVAKKSNKEGYENLNSKQILAYKNFVLDIVTDLNRYYIQVSNSTFRKPRKQKGRSAEQHVKDLKYLQRDNALKIVSIEPANIIGADSLWVYNTKYKQLTVYNAEDQSGLMVKGTTLHGYSANNSCRKTLRKPEAMLKELLVSGKVALRTYMKNLKGKALPLTGRINADTVLLKVSK